jgi:hypothetical protein
VKFSILSADRDTTGGLRWHLRAFLQRRRWRATSALIADWLSGTRPASSHLLLIGGSAGWMMSSPWLQRFRRIDLIDIDPHAFWLFQLNHGRALRTSGSHLAFFQTDGLKELDRLLSDSPEATIFFDNVLGQHLYRVRDMARAESELQQLASRLKGRDWGSVHDLYSGPADSNRAVARPVSLYHAINDAQGLAVNGLRETPMHRLLLSQVGGHDEWMDHLTSSVFPTGTSSQLIAWPFLPDYAHWLQAGWVAGSGSGSGSSSG